MSWTPAAKLSDYDYYLPPEAIALRPAVPRDSARLLHIGGGAFSDHHMSDLPHLLQAGDLLVVNNSKVISAHLTGIRAARPQGGGGDVSISLNLHKQVAENCWHAFARPAKRLRIGDEVRFSANLIAQVTEKHEGNVCLRFSKSGSALSQAVEKLGNIPLPPYIGRQRAVDENDEHDYQTIFADPAGSVAAPTAGLHFTPALMDALSAKNIETTAITLHVGAGTFLPVTSEEIADHTMHSEIYEIGEKAAQQINRALDEGRRIVAIGTTSLRALESAAENGQVRSGLRETDIFITPGYRFKVVSKLVTNFHLPRSTLFMLVCAFSGWKTMPRAYRYAIENGYRFYSYGDACLLGRGAP